MHDPASGEVLARVTHAKAVETKAAIAEASSVFGMWSAKSGLERSNILRRWVYYEKWGFFPTGQAIAPTALLISVPSSGHTFTSSFPCAPLSCSWFELLRENQDDIATLMVLESGKPLAQAKAEITSG